jgi:hypothetical protein
MGLVKRGLKKKKSLFGELDFHLRMNMFSTATPGGRFAQSTFFALMLKIMTY